MSEHDEEPQFRVPSAAEIADSMGSDAPTGIPLSELSYHYDPTPTGPLAEPGVTQGYVVMWSGEPGPARIAEATMLTDPDGGFTLTARDGGDSLEFTDCAVVDDGEKREQ